MGQELEIGSLAAICLAMIGLAVCFRESAGPIAVFVRCASVFTGLLAILTAVATADSLPFLAVSTGVIGAGFVGTLRREQQMRLYRQRQYLTRFVLDLLLD